MTAEPHLTKDEMLAQCRAGGESGGRHVPGVRTPHLYDLTYQHNNCAGRCVRAGQAQWRLLLRTHPDRFAQAERQESAMRAELGDVAILTRQRGGVKRPFPLSQLREEEQGARAAALPGLGD